MDGHEDIQERLEAVGFDFLGKERTRNDNGWILRFDGGVLVNVFDTGTVQPQGKRQADVRQALGLTVMARESKVPYGPKPVSRNVFVVYGHDQEALLQTEVMLRRWRLEPMILPQLPSEGKTIIEKLERYTQDENVAFAVVLATPDDEGHSRGKPNEKRLRARQNVVFELGLLLDRLGREKVAILLKDQANMEKPSDIDGLIYIPFNDTVEDARVQLAKEMKKQGIDVDLSRL